MEFSQVDKNFAVTLLRRLIQEEIGSVVQNYNEEQEQELDDLWQEFEDRFN